MTPLRIRFSNHALNERADRIAYIATTIGFGEVPYRKDQVMHLEADITELTKDTGWVPSTKFDDGIRMILSNKS